MTTVDVGSRIVVRGATSTVVLRALRSVELDGGWALPVMGDPAALKKAGVPSVASVEVRTTDGPVALDAEVVLTEGVFMLRAPGLRTAAIMEQRREDVRARVSLTLRGAVLDRAGGRPVPGGASLSGRTRSVSAGGLGVVLDGASPAVEPGSRVYVEITMPSGDIAPAVATVLARDGAGPGALARLQFLDISPLDRERLVRLVFAQQRAELAERRQSVRKD